MAFVICHFFRKFCQDDDEDEEYTNADKPQEGVTVGDDDAEAK